jgi:hypothetical protein
MVSILLYTIRLLIIYYFGEDQMFGLNIYYADSEFHQEMNMGAQVILLGIGVVFLFFQFYLLSL